MEFAVWATLTLAVLNLLSILIDANISNVKMNYKIGEKDTIDKRGEKMNDSEEGKTITNICSRKFYQPGQKVLKVNNNHFYSSCRYMLCEGSNTN